MFVNTLQPLNLAKAVYSVAMLAVFFLISLATAQAATINLAWDAVTGASGYEVHYGTASGNYNVTGSSPLKVVGSTTTSVTIPLDGVTYYFAVKAYDSASGKVSGFSNEANNPIAKFSANKITVATGESLQFTNSSTGTVTGWSWNFGDGTTSTLQNPSKSYTATGTYNVSLVVTGLGGITSPVVTQTITVNAPSATAPVASFTATPVSGTAPLFVTLTDTSTGTVSTRTWDLGDGTTSTAQSVAKTYNSAGTYTAKLTVNNGNSSSTTSKTISATATAPVASFTASPSSGVAPLATTFANTSTGTILSYAWNFGDSTTSTAQNPSKTYANAGTYTVTLTATGPTGTTPSTKTQTITVSAASASTGGLVAAYNFQETTGTVVVDESGKGNHGIISGATRTSSGKFSKALSFDGIDDWVTVNDSASLDLTNGMTLEAWVYPTATMSGWQSVITKEQPGGFGAVYYLAANSDLNQPEVAIYNTSWKKLYGGSAPSVNQWTHLAGTYDGATLRLYANGSLVSSQAQAGVIQVTNGALRIGGNGYWGEFFRGRVDEIRIYNRALSASEIQADMSKAVVTKLLVGNSSTTSSVTDALPQNVAQAFKKAATVTGMVNSLQIYVNSGSTSTRLVAGLYADNNGHPGTLLAQGELNNPTASAWNTVPLTKATSVIKGSTYWLAILSPTGILQFRDKVGGAAEPSETSAQTTLTSLPGTWTIGTVLSEGPLAGYGAGN